MRRGREWGKEGGLREGGGSKGKGKGKGKGENGTCVRHVTVFLLLHSSETS